MQIFKVVRLNDKRFINDIDNGKLIDTKGELSTIHYSGAVDFYELWEFLNKLNDEIEQLKKENQRLEKQKNVLIDYMDNWCPRRFYDGIIKRMEEVE